MLLTWLIPPESAPSPCSAQSAVTVCLSFPTGKWCGETTWGKEEAEPSWDVELILGLASGPLPKPIQCPAALQEAQAELELRELV